MPSATKHLKYANKHREVAEKLATDDDCRGWAAVVLFYAARDLVHAVLDADPDLPHVCRHPKSHTNQDPIKPGTNVVVKRHYRALEIQYMALYSTSLGVRYEGQLVNEQLWAETWAEFVDLCGTARWHLDSWDRAIPTWLNEVCGD